MDPLTCLFVGDQNDLPEIRRLTDELPCDAYGHIFVEVASRLQVQRWEPPVGMQVSWLCRDESGEASSSAPARGELAVRALRAWASEWLPDGCAGTTGPVAMWVGCHASPLVTYEFLELRERLHPAPDESHATRHGCTDCDC